MGVELRDRVAIVTGAAQGIGEATARKLAERGATVVGIDIAAERLSKVMESIPEGLALPVDITDPEADQRVVQEVHDRYGRVDILANVAGGILGAPAGIDRITIKDWHRLLDLNLHAPFYLSLAVAPIMRAQKWGRIITVGSGAGRSYSRTGILPYASAKAGVAGLMRQLAVELAPDNVLCNVVSPGMIMTPQGKGEMDRRTEAERAEVFSTIAIKRTGDAMEIANVIAFLASEEASYVVGQTISVDGGHWMF